MSRRTSSFSRESSPSTCSSARRPSTVYRQPSPSYPLVEDAPLWNPGWQYATDKIACEDILRRETGFPSTIVRPAHTYGETRIPRHSLVFDNAKLKRFVPGFEATSSFAEGIERSLAWVNADSARKTVDAERDALLDRIIARST
jgi:hypothetical protein